MVSLLKRNVAVTLITNGLKFKKFYIRPRE